MVQVGSQGEEEEEEEEVVAMMKAIVVEGIDPIRDRRQINAICLLPPNCLLVVKGTLGIRDLLFICYTFTESLNKSLSHEREKKKKNIKRKLGLGPVIFYLTF